MTFWNSMFFKSQAVLSAIRKVSMSKFDKNILPYKKLELNMKIVKDKIEKPLSLMKKIHYSHLEDPAKQDIRQSESCLKLRPDRVVMQDATAQMAMQQLMSSVLPSTIHCNHLIEAQTGGVKDLKRANVDNKEVFSYLKTASANDGVGLWHLCSEMFRVAPLCASDVRTTQTESVAAGSNESIIVPGFPKPNGLPQPNPFDGPERDLVNFPRMVRLEEPAKTRYLFVPEEWFEIFYKKTGVTGPYVLAAGITTYVLSKEIWVVDHEFPYVLATIGLFYFGWKKIGASLAHYLDKEIYEYEASCKAIRKSEIDGLIKNIEHQKKEVWKTGAQKHIIQAKRENVAFQLEAIYRERAVRIHNQVKRRLEYHLELAKTTRTVQHRIMVNWIVENVMKSINEQEKKIFEKCIVHLQALAVKA